MEENVKSISQLLQTVGHQLINAAANKNCNTFRSGIRHLDELLRNFYSGTLVTIGGMCGMGKTSFALNLVNEFAIKQHHPVLFFSLEGTYTSWTNRLLSIVCNIKTTALNSRELNADEWVTFEKLSRSAENAHIYLEAKMINHIDKLCEMAREVKEKHDIHIIFIDYVQLLNARDGYSDNRYLDLNYITRRLKELAKELEVPVVILSQLNRHRIDGEALEEKRPRLADLRDSGTVADDSDMVILLHRPEYYHIYSDERGNDLHGLIEISVPKNRLGPLGRCYAKFNTSTGLMSDASDLVDNMGFEVSDPLKKKGSIPPPPPLSDSLGPLPF